MDDWPGTMRLIHDHQDGVWGPTSACFGVSADDSSTLYVVTDGNLFAADWEPWMVQSTEIMQGMVLRTDVGVEGAPVPDE